MTDFVHLHVHSDYSLQDAAVSVMALADKAEKLGMKYLALTDHGNMFGVMEFLTACKETINEKGWHVKRENPIKPIIGCEVYVSPGSRFEKEGSENDNRYYHLILLAMNKEGYNNLMKLSSFAYTEGFYYKPRIDEELLQKYHGGIIALSACASGEIPYLIQAGKFNEALQKANYYKDLFGNDEKGNPNFYLEIQEHGIPANELRGTHSQKEINKALFDISGKTGIPLAATNDVHYLDREDNITHDILLCIGTGKTRAEEKRIRYFGDQFYLKSADEMARLFPEHPEAVSNTMRIAERCNVDIPKVNGEDLPKFLPVFDIPDPFKNSGEYLKHITLIGLAKRYAKEKEAGGKIWDDILKRAEHELEMITQMGFAGYFLIVEDFVRWAQENNIPVGYGRGSGVASIVAYSLHITGVDPLKYKLLFERFLNLERISMPDFDVDFTNEGRDDVIRYVTEKYGRDRVGQIITFGTLGAKAVIKDVARVLGISIPESEMITKLIPSTPGISLKKAMEGEPRLGEYADDPRYTELFTFAKKLEGLNRHSSVHASGVVIGRSSLHDFVPLYRDPKTGLIATQYDMNHLEACGLVKMDFLGLKTLDVIKHTMELIRKKGGKYSSFSLDDINEDDKETFKILGEGKSFGVFQFESDGMQNILKRTKPSSIEDLIALVSLYRPGPMEYIGQFIDSKNGRQAISYPDPSLEETLKDTYGVIVYQEQVMQVARIIAGYTLGQADILRRAMGKKIKEILDQEKIPFLQGAAKQGYPQAKAEEIFDMLVPFAGYGFNKSHAAAYAMVSYHTAYLKANFPIEFMAANLSNEINATDKDKLSICIGEARKMGLSIDPPDINKSGKYFTVVEGSITYGLLGIKGLGDASAEEIIRGRKEGPYVDFLDFLDRVDIKTVGKSVIERLIQTGAFDNFNIKREKLLGNFERSIEYTQNVKEDKKFGQSSLFGDTEEKEYSGFIFEDFPESSRSEKLKIEKELIGFYFSGHPMDEYRDLWKKLVKFDLSLPETLIPGSCTLVGIIKTIKTHIGKSGKMAFVTLEDYNGEIDLTFFSKVWEKSESKIEIDQVAIIHGKIEYQKDKDRYGFLADEVLSPEKAENFADKQNTLFQQLDEFKGSWEREVKLNLGNMADVDFQKEYILIGIIKNLKPFQTKKGNEMAYAVMADYRGEINVTIFPKPWADLKDKLVDETVAALKGKIKNDDYSGKPVFYADSLVNIKADKGKNEVNNPDFHIRLEKSAVESEETLHSLRNILIENPGPSSVYIHIPLPEGETVIRTANQIKTSSAASELNHWPEISKVWEQ